MEPIMMMRTFGLVLAICFSWTGEAAAQFKPLVVDASDEFFDKGEIPSLKIVLSVENSQKLRNNPREYVTCDVIENNKTTYKNVGLKLKGAAGSFRNLDDRPALSLNMDKFEKKQMFHDMDKFHLNNSVQDESLLSEAISTDLFLQAGLPATRVTHARVWINNRDLGIYVLKEGFGKQFLKRWFTDTKGNLYDGGFCQDLNAELEKDSGKGPDDRSDLKAIVAACQEGDPILRGEKLEKLVNLDHFIAFMAIERMACHWDGYASKANNYRVYFDPTRKQAIFLPHGMDQMFGELGMNILDGGGAMVASAVMQSEPWRKKYREVIRTVIPLFSPKRIHAKIDEIEKRLQPVVRKMDAGRAKYLADLAKDFKRRITERDRILKKQNRTPEDGKIDFDKNGVASLKFWNPQIETEDSELEELEEKGKTTGYRINTGGSNRAIASWRQPVQLPKGKYKFVAKATLREVESLDGEQGGVIARMSGGPKMGSVVGNGEQAISYDIEVTEDRRDVVLVLELRAKKGEVIFQANSLKLIRQNP
jgi:spore coat protein H